MSTPSPFNYNLLQFDHFSLSTRSNLHSMGWIHVKDPEFNPEDRIGFGNENYQLVHRKIPSVDVEAVSHYIDTRHYDVAWGVGRAIRSAWEFLKQLGREKELPADEREKLQEDCNIATDRHIENIEKFRQAEKQDADCLADNIPTPAEALTWFSSPRCEGVSSLDSSSVDRARCTLSATFAREKRSQHYPSDHCPKERDNNPLDPGRVSPSAGRGAHQCSPELAARILAAIEAELSEKEQRRVCDPQGIQYLRRQKELRRQIEAEQSQTVSARRQLCR